MGGEISLRLNHRKEVKDASVLCEMPCQEGDEGSEKHNDEEWQPATQGICPTCGIKMFRIGKA